MNRLARQLSWNSPLLNIALIGAASLYGLALSRLSLLNACLLTLFSLAGVGTLIEPLVGLLTTLFLGILWAWLRAELPSVPPLIAMPMLALTLGAWLMRGAARRDIRLHTPSLLFPLLLFIGAAALSLWDAIEMAVYGAPELIKWLQILALFWLVVDHIQGRRLPWLAGGLLLIGTFQALVGLWQFGLRGTGPDHYAILGGRFYRAYGTFEQPNPYAGFLGLVFPLGAGMTAEMVRAEIGRLKRPSALFLLLCAATGLLGAALLASWSRGAWLGAGAAAVVMLIALPRRTWVGLLLVALLLAGALGLERAGMLPASLSARLTGFTQYARFQDVRGAGINDANYAVVERLAHWQAALEMWRANFWNGVGIGDYEPAYPAYRLLNWPIALGHAHNYYLNIAAETGLIGLSAYLLLWGTVFWQGWRASRRLSGWRRGLALGLMGAFTHLSVHHLFDNLYVNNVHLVIGTMLGMVALLNRFCPGSTIAPGDATAVERS